MVIGSLLDVSMIDKAHLQAALSHLSWLVPQFEGGTDLIKSTKHIPSSRIPYFDGYDGAVHLETCFFMRHVLLALILND